MMGKGITKHRILIRENFVPFFNAVREVGVQELL